MVYRKVRLEDGSEIEVGLSGDAENGTIMLPGAKKSVYGEAAEQLRMWGVDPELGERMVSGLTGCCQVLCFDYEGHRFAHPDPDGLTAERIAKDMLTIADAMGVRRFSYYGYSWLALAGLQLAIRTDRLEGLAMGGYPPLEGPYKEMLIVTTYTYEQALDNGKQTVVPQEGTEQLEAFDWDNVQVAIDPRVAQQFVTLYTSLSDFDDRCIQDRLRMPRLAFAGEQDTIVYGANFGGVTVDIAGILERNRRQLTEFGWEVEIMRGAAMDHTRAMQPEAALPLVKNWLRERVRTSRR